MKLAFVVVTLLLLGGWGNYARADQALVLKRVGSGFTRPVFAASPPGDANRLFVVEQHTGQIEILNLQDGSVLSDPFLTIRSLSRGDEQGLLGFTFDPNYNTNGFFYVNYTDSGGDTNVRRFKVSDNPNIADAASSYQLLKFDQPQANHNGGWLGFSPVDRFLYISSGDGGAGDDTGAGHTAATGNAQDITNNLLGKMLRIDPSQDGFPDDAQRNYSIPPSNPLVDKDGDDEIWSFGLRNPWRPSFDRANGDLYMGDVGQGAREEIDYQPVASKGGENYGWRLREGFIRTPGAVGGNPPSGNVEPIHDYRHVNTSDGGFSVTGGYVYRGPVKELQGAFFFADYVTNQVWSLRHDGTKATEVINWTEMITTDAGAVGSISSFAEDDAGNLYVMNLDEGDIFRIEDLVLSDNVLGDFNVDGSLDVTDLDLLTSAIRGGQMDPKFDVNRDGQVSLADRSHWVTALKNTWFGDSNLDGEFGSGDLVSVFQSGKYEDGIAGNSSWSDGDWDGDGDFSTSDLVFAFQVGGYEKGPRPAAAAVPEPAGAMMLFLALIAIRARIPRQTGPTLR